MYIIVAVAFGRIIQDYLGYRMSLFEKLPTLHTFNSITGYVLWQLILALFFVFSIPVGDLGRYLQVSLSMAE